jgi:hypothetical protein
VDTFSRRLLLCTTVLICTSPLLSAQSDWVEWGFVDGTSVDGEFGNKVIAIGDINNDQFDDYAVTSPRSSEGNYLGGTISLHSGQDNSVLASIHGSQFGDKIGYDICYLGEHDLDGLIKIATSSPFATGINGPFSGLVRIFAYDQNNQTFSLWQEIGGESPGNMFGASIEAIDQDGDNDLDLVVSAIGYNILDGGVFIYNLNSVEADINNPISYAGIPSSREMFGWALSRDLGSINGDSLLVGAPFAGTNNAGRVISIKANGQSSERNNPLENINNAHLGYSVAAGSDITGDGLPDNVASAPDTATGSVIIWDTPSATGNILQGSQANEKFGYSIDISLDTNFDGADDLIVGAPHADSLRGRFSVYDATSLAFESIFSEEGVEAGHLYGIDVAEGGDLNQTGQHEILVSAMGVNNNTGRIYIYAPPEEDLGPIDLEIEGSFEWETEAEMQASNLATGGGGNLYWYVGTSQGSSTSNEGYELDISGNVELISITPNPGVTYTEYYLIEDTIPDGQELFFQVIEDRSGFIRKSDVEDEEVEDPGVTLFVNGDQADEPMNFETKWGMPNSPVYIYGSPYPPSNNPVYTAPDGSWNINIKRAVPLSQPGDQSNSDGNFTSNPITAPSVLAGLTIYFQAYDWDFFQPALTRVVPVEFE